MVGGTKKDQMMEMVIIFFWLPNLRHCEFPEFLCVYG